MADRGFEKRSCPKLVRYKPSELAFVSERARACGRPVACYIRETSIGKALHTQRAPANDALIRQLARLANRLTKLAQVVAAKQLSEAAEFRACLDALLDPIKQID
jgi:hypothetical protein